MLEARGFRTIAYVGGFTQFIGCEGPSQLLDPSETMSLPSCSWFGQHLYVAVETNRYAQQNNRPKSAPSRGIPPLKDVKNGKVATFLIVCGA